MDYYMRESNVVDRLVEEWKEHGQLVIAYDFDNTVFDYHKKGHTYEFIIELLRECKELNAHLMVYTARHDDELEFVKKYLNENNIPFDSINETPDFLPFENGKKLYYNILLDDRAGLNSAYYCLFHAKNIIKYESKQIKEY